jgi:hypothetical protein
VRFRELESALIQALGSAKSLDATGDESSDKPSSGELAGIPAELAREIAERIRAAAEMGDIAEFNSIAEEIKDQSDACKLLGRQIVQMAEDFDLEGMQKLVDALDSQ